MIEKSFNTGALSLNYAEGSPGGQPLLLLHGQGMRWQEFANLIPDLERGWHLYALDLRGHGKSDRAESYRIQDFVPDIVSFIRDGIKQPAIIFGHSLGGMISFMVAAGCPDLVRALIIGDSVLSTESLQASTEKLRGEIVKWREYASRKDLDFIVSELKQALIPVPGGKELVPARQVFGEDHPFYRYQAETFSQLDPEVLSANLDHFDEAFAEYRIDRLLPQVRCPVLIIQANVELGGLESDEDVENALSLLPEVSHIKIGHVGHLLHARDKDAVLKAMIPFLKSFS